MKNSIQFYKYHGAGNDFILLDGRGNDPLAGDRPAIIRKLCHRRFGIGADGCIVITQKSKEHLGMAYFNSDGLPGTLCGNGGRCTVWHAFRMGMTGRECTVSAIDGAHRARVVRDEWVEIELHNIDSIEKCELGVKLDTGSPHLIRWTDDVEEVDMRTDGRFYRHHPLFGSDGINVNFVQNKGGTLRIRTYERGVEDETLSCGTGTVAAALAASLEHEDGPLHLTVESRGGTLEVRFTKKGARFTDIWLCGPAVEVCQGIFHMD